jgi:hypothetical protein
MKIRRVVFGLIGIIGLGIAFGVGRYFQHAPTCPGNTRCITVSVESVGKCQVDYPVANLSYSNEFVQWFSKDDKYSVTFLNVTPPAGSTPLPLGYSPENPLHPQQEPVYFDQSHPSRAFNLNPKEKYFYYAIFDQNYPNNPCKASTDDRDTGLNVKR